jgi:titin
VPNLHASIRPALALALALSACADATAPRRVPSAPTLQLWTGTSTQLVLAFSPPDDDGGSRILRYEYSLDSGSTWVSRVPADTSSPLVISGLTNGTRYVVQLRAANRIGAGPATPAVGMTPRGLPAAPVVSAVTPGDGTLSVAFAPIADGGDPLTNLEVRLGAGSPWVPRSPASTASPVLVAGLVNGTSYDVQIRGVNAVGPGAASTAVSATPRTVPAAPTLDAASAGYRSALLSVTAGATGGAPITTYEYSFDGTVWTPRSPAGTGSPFLIGGDLADNTEYTVRVRAVNAAGAGPASLTQTFRTGPGVPLWHSGSADSVSLTLCSQPVPGAASYIYVATSSPTGGVTDNISLGTPCAGYVGFERGAERFWRVRTCSVDGVCSPLSPGQIRVVTPTAAPTITGALTSPGQVTFAFSVPAHPTNPAAATNIQYSLNNGATWITRAPASVASPLTVTGLASGSTVNIRVRAINAAGLSAASPVLQIVIP